LLQSGRPEDEIDEAVPSDGEYNDASDDDSQPSIRRNDSEEEDGEDLMDNMEADYRPMEHLDRYERDGIDQGFVDDVTEEERFAARLAAERELAARDRFEGVGSVRKGRLPAALAEELEGDDEFRPRRRRRVEDAQTGFDDEEGEEQDVAINLEEPRGPVKDFIAEEAVQREIKRQFRKFLLQFTDDHGDAVYAQRLRDMVRANKSTLEVDYVDLAHWIPQVAIWVADLPNDVLPILDETGKDVASSEFDGYEAIQNHVYIRIANLPLQESIRDLRHFHINQLVRVDGVVTRRTGVYPQLDRIMFDCEKCGAVLGPHFQTGDKEIKLNSCSSCMSKGPFSVNTKETVYRNYQRVTLQESPGNVPAGRLPRSKDILLLNDLVDCARPGEEIIVTGVFEHSFQASQNAKHGFPVYSTLIKANHIAKKGSAYAAARLTDEDRNEIRELAKDPRIGERIIKSIAPSIYGHENIKTAIALSLFGGQEKHPSNTHRLRGDINVLLLGDPGTAKSQFLKYVEGCAHRAVYTTGKGASAVGLTAAVHKDPITREWTLEGGALVLADRGVCLIDEFDKMNDQDRVSIHEAMEQQSISISKAGIVTQLQARCSVIAAANPVGGRYDSSRTFSENVELTEPILSRFDVLCVIRDIVDPVNDEKLADFVVGSHANSHPHGAQDDEENNAPEEDPDIIPQDLLKKYITFAKQTCKPRLHSGDYDKIATVYTELRRESSVTQGMPIAVRHLESMIRMSEARAAMHLREYVNDDDIDAAIKTMLESFVSTQKLSIQKVMRRKFSRFIVTKGDYNSLVLFKLRECLRDARSIEQITGQIQDKDYYNIPLRQLEERCRELGIANLAPFMQSSEFTKAGFEFASDGNMIRLART
jgi:DNA replication licensing factor MCM2